MYNIYLCIYNDYSNGNYTSLSSQTFKLKATPFQLDKRRS